MPSFHNLTYKPMTSYRELTKNEAERLNMPASKETLTLCNQKRGSVIAFAHKKLGFITGALAGDAAMRDRLKQDYQKQYPDITDLEDFDIEIAGKVRHGFKFRFTQGANKLYSEVVSVTENKHCYTISLSCNYKERNTAGNTFHVMLKSLSFDA